MNFDEAIAAHANWKMKLSAYVKNPDKSVNAAVLATDNHCALGKWIYGEGLKFANLPEYQELKKGHAAFHQAAAAIVKRADAGEQVSEEVNLGAQSDYNKLSTQVVTQIMKMKAKVPA